MSDSQTSGNVRLVRKTKLPGENNEVVTSVSASNKNLIGRVTFKLAGFTFTVSRKMPIVGLLRKIGATEVKEAADSLLPKKKE